ncbi:uncharacterized protein N7459_007658 [Penicillium hispanicum]|uniref:uncharacterized protein n=1 Tax=Penicillium hispanicum TaxID=1080232 RepID=UPI00253FC747|nr:uncharacterized protein N7459_007658 [Penicillium hispanicum]KAJ5578694.1 hypothetical protein N7459_007658 [Penicillium hispanicum]
MLARSVLALSALAAVTSGSVIHLEARTPNMQDDYPQNIGHPVYCQKLGTCSYNQTLPDPTATCDDGYKPSIDAEGTKICEKICSDDEKKECQYYACDATYEDCQHDASLPSCSDALRTCEAVGGRPMSETDCQNILTDPHGTVCPGCTSYSDDGRCHLLEEAYKQFAKTRLCRKWTDACNNGQGRCSDAVNECWRLGGAEISSEECGMVGREVGGSCTSYSNGRCVLNSGCGSQR